MYVKIRAWCSSEGPLKLKLAPQSGQSAFSHTPPDVEAETYSSDSLAL